MKRRVSGKTSAILQYNWFESIHVFESIQATRMQIAFAKLLEFWFFFSRMRSVFACWRSFYPFLNEKVFLFHCKMLYWNETFKMFIPRVCCLYSINLFGLNFLNMLPLLSHLLHVMRKGKSLNSSHYVTPIKLRSHRSSGAFLYVRNYLHSCMYLFLSRYF